MKFAQARGVKVVPAQIVRVPRPSESVNLRVVVSVILPVVRQGGQTAPGGLVSAISPTTAHAKPTSASLIPRSSATWTAWWSNASDAWATQTNACTRQSHASQSRRNTKVEWLTAAASSALALCSIKVVVRQVRQQPHPKRRHDTIAP